MENLNNKIAMIADIHANNYCLEKALAEIQKREIENILFLGDYITDGFENNKVLEVVKKYPYVIAGNRDLSVAGYDGVSWDKVKQFKNMLYAYHDISEENKQYLRQLPFYKIITLQGRKICLSHGTPWNVRENVLADSFTIFDKLIKDYDCDIYLFGHMHKAFCTHYKNKLFINPGSIITPADTPTAKYGLLNLNNLEYEQKEIQYDIPELRNYYLNSDYFLQNKQWCNILIHNNETGIDYVCNFIDFIQKKAKKEGISIKENIPNDLWDVAFIEFMHANHLTIY